MTLKPAPSPIRKFLPYILILISLPLLGCNLLNRIGIGSSDPDTMSVEEALEITPLDSRPTMLEEMGPPDAFTITFQDLEGQIVRWESWSYFDYTSQFDFIDGELLWNIELEPVPDGSIFAHFYDPADFVAGMTPAQVKDLLSDQELLEVNLAALDQEGALALAGDQILLGFDHNQLVYVETVILSPDPDGLPLADFEPVLDVEVQPAETDSDPTESAPVESDPALFQDDFEGDTALAKPIFDTSFMEYGVIDGQGILTTHYVQAVMVAYYDAPVLKDFILEVDIRPLGFVQGAKAGVMFRSENPTVGADYYYTISVMPSDQQIRFESWYGGEWAVWEFQDIPQDLIPKYGIYKLKIDCQDDSIRVYLSDQLAAEFTNSLIQDPGNFGLTIVSSRVPETVAFDNLVITEHP
ncbi:MAG: DUF1080 domain-containing protein [Anaerolineales bacterium]|nr:MAG: DUF1080 domain-containing protein [Anaerolineales bacterium]